MNILLNNVEIRFSLSGISTGITPLRFQGKEAVSTLYEFTVLALIEGEPLQTEQVLHTPALLTVLEANGASHVYTGMTSGVDLVRRAQGYGLYTISFGPRFAKMRLGQYSRLFLGDDQDALLGGRQVATIFPELAGKMGLPADAYDFSALGNIDFKRHLVCQYNESNYDFCARWLEHLGGYFYFEHGEGGEKLVAARDKASAPTTSPGRFEFHQGQGLSRGGKGAVTRLDMRTAYAPAEVRVRDYNPETPSVEISASHAIGKGQNGDVYLFDEFLRSPAEARFIAQMRAERLAAERLTFAGEADGPGLRPGHLFSLGGHPNPAFNEAFFLTSVHHYGEQTERLSGLLDAAGLGDLRDEARNFYRCVFTCIPASVQFRPARSTAIPKIAGIIPGIVDAAAGETYAELDDSEGRYKVIFPFENADAPAGKGSSFLRMAQPYAGSKNGMHFPLLKGSEVGIGFTGGNVDRPYIECALPNAGNPSVSTESNPTQLCIVSLKRNVIIAEDLKGQERWEFYNPSTNTRITYGMFRTEQGGLRQGILKTTPNNYVDYFGGARHCMISGNASYSGVGAGMYISTGGDYFLKVNAANREEKTTGTYEQTTTGDKSTVITGNHTVDTAVGADEKAIGTYMETVNGDLNEIITGKYAITSSIANFSTKITDGYFFSESKSSMNVTSSESYGAFGFNKVGIDSYSMVYFNESTGTQFERHSNLLEIAINRTSTCNNNKQYIIDLKKYTGISWAVRSYSSGIRPNSYAFGIATVGLCGLSLGETLTKIELSALKVGISLSKGESAAVTLELKTVENNIAGTRRYILRPDISKPVFTPANVLGFSLEAVGIGVNQDRMDKGLEKKRQSLEADAKQREKDGTLPYLDSKANRRSTSDFEADKLKVRDAEKLADEKISTDAATAAATEKNAKENAEKYPTLPPASGTSAERDRLNDTAENSRDTIDTAGTELDKQISQATDMPVDNTQTQYWYDENREAFVPDKPICNPLK